jgi:hypothetical protein
VAEDGFARLRKVEIARDFGREVEVSDGPNDPAIVNPPVNLYVSIF